MTDDLREFLQEAHQISDELLIEMTPGRIWPHASDGDENDENEKGRSYSLPYPVKPPIGASIGTSRHPGRTGTLGGYVELVKDGVVKPCALTCAHVVAPLHKQEQSRQGDEKPIPPIKSGDGRGTDVLFPSIADHEASLEIARAAERRFQSRRQHIVRRIELFDESDRYAEELEPVGGKVDGLRGKIDEADNDDRVIGSVFSESGWKLLPGDSPKSDRRIDWALIELKAERDSTDGEVRILDKVGAPSEELCVRKIGRTSRITEGVINAVESCLNHDDRGREIETWEWPVVANGRDFPHFSYPGDSGALIIDQADSLVIGLLWGGMDNGVCHDRTYFTPIEIVAKHILDTTGYHIRLQGGEDICCKVYGKTD
ncbi:hypothetical protein FQN54_001783 [Arachnomyces sp. PD_36]|nr:hypothetical protein FQN54_001783 [Arachnomyces sp. PD_36]